MTAIPSPPRTPLSAGTQTAIYMTIGVLLFVFGVVWAIVGPTADVEYRVVEGIGVFAALYVIAQAGERVAEWFIDLLSLIPESPEQRKEDALREVRATNSVLNGKSEAVLPRLVEVAEQKQANEAEVDAARRDIRFLAHGVSVAICALAVNSLNYGLLKHVGADGVEPGIDRLFTVFAAAGGTKALHELIGRVQQAKESAQSGA